MLYIIIKRVTLHNGLSFCVLIAEREWGHEDQLPSVAWSGVPTTQVSRTPRSTIKARPSTCETKEVGFLCGLRGRFGEAIVHRRGDASLEAALKNG